MSTNHRDSTTSVTLLLRLRDPTDQQAWQSFVERYTPRIYGWCRRFHLQASDVADVSQDVLAKLVVAMRSFDYDPSRGTFRAWMKTVTRNAVHDLMRDWEKHVQGSGDTKVLDRLSRLQDTDAFEALAAEIEAEYQRELLALAAQRVQMRVKPNTWKAYHLAATHELPPAYVAERLGMRVAEVYVAKSRVIKLLNEEVQKLDGT